MVKYHHGKLYCEVCGQGFIQHVRINKLSQEAYICEECDCMWLQKNDIGDRRTLDFGTFMEENNLPWNWDELTLLD